MGSPSVKCMPPAFGGEKSYERWKTELQAWQLVTGTEKKKRAITVALTFPEGSEVRDRVFNEIDLEELDADDGVDKLVEYMDKWYKKDKLASAYDSWSDFDNFRKSDDLTMESYITEFEKRQKKLVKHDIAIPNSVLAFKLLDCAGLSHRDKQLALTAVDYKTPDTMFQQMSVALKKFFGRKAVPSSSDSNVGTSTAISIKSEPVCMAEEVNFTGQGRSRSDSGIVQQRGSRGFASYRGNRISRSLQRKNPLDYKGMVTKCHICRSEFHYANKCPQREKRVYESQVEECHEEKDEVYLTCGKRNEEDMRVLVSETFNCAVLDSACSSTVCGIDWLDNYVQSLPDHKLSQVYEEKSSATFKFGDGKVVPSLKKVVFPCVLAGEHCKIRSDVVESDIPLLFGKPSMKKAKVKLDLENDTAQILGKDIKLKCTPSGHYCVPLTDENFSYCVWQVLTNDKSERQEKRKQVLKLHQQFGHPSVKRLRQLLKDAGVKDAEYFMLIDEVNDGCNTCKKYRRTPSRPVVSLPLARDFNEVVAMDLKE